MGGRGSRCGFKGVGEEGALDDKTVFCIDCGGGCRKLSMCRQFVQKSFALCNQKEHNNDNLKTLRMLLLLQSIFFTEAAEICVLAVSHDMESKVLMMRITF